ncbi:MAG TPA: hypothetical protein VGH28_00370 [Polyangiaceae bacterium]|jgi:hypothetical protein
MLGFGGCGATAGWETIQRYRGVQLESPTGDLAHQDSRQAASAAYDQWTAALESEHARGFPFAVAELVLGLALSAFAMGAWVGRGGARRAVVQITVAQALLVAAAFVAMPRSRAAEINFRLQVAESRAVEAHQPIDPKTVPALRIVAHASTIAFLLFRTVAAGLIVVALTRPRARAYYDPQAQRPNEG